MLISGPKISGRTRRNPISPKAPTAIILVRPSLSDNRPNKRAPAQRSTSTRSMARAVWGRADLHNRPTILGKKMQNPRVNVRTKHTDMIDAHLHVTEDY